VKHESYPEIRKFYQPALETERFVKPEPMTHLLMRNQVPMTHLFMRKPEPMTHLFMRNQLLHVSRYPCSTKFPNETLDGAEFQFGRQQSAPGRSYCRSSSVKFPSQYRK